MRFFFMLFFSLAFIHINAQIILNNPSFEDEPSDATIPMGWFGCERNTTPDICPGPWGVENEASEGNTYVGLITRNDGSFEAIAQRLSQRIKKGECYSFSISTCVSDTYSGFNNHVKFRIWGSNKKCKKSQLLFESDTVDYEDWKKHNIRFKAKKNLKYIIIEAYHLDSANPLKGHVLFDQLTSLVPCDKV